MGSSAFEIIINAVKIIVIFLIMVQLVPVLVWVERRGSAFIQNRLGPNRVGPLGLTQLLADAVKFLMKEEFVPGAANKVFFYLAPIVALIPGALAFAVLPLSTPIIWGQYQFLMQGYDIGVGVVFVLGVSSLATYAVLFAGWGSANKFSMMGALRAAAQVISYELGLGLALVGIILIYGTFDFTHMIESQTGPLTFMAFSQKITWFSFLPNWGIFYQPLGAVLFFITVFAESNRLPFDLPEAESELIAGFHTEYGGLKMLMFFIGEYGHMMVASGLMAIFYFGGYQLPWISPAEIYQLLVNNCGLSPNLASLLNAVLHFGVMMGKILFFLWIFIWVRWTLPRFRYDQLMDLGWKTILPWALANAIGTACIMFILS